MHFSVIRNCSNCQRIHTKTSRCDVRSMCYTDKVGLAGGTRGICEQVCHAQPEELKAVAEGISQYVACYLNKPTAGAATSDAAVQAPTEKKLHHLHDSKQRRPPRPHANTNAVTHAAATPPAGREVATRQAGPSSLRRKRDRAVQVLQSLDDTALDRASQAWYGKAMACVVDIYFYLAKLAVKTSPSGHAQDAASGATGSGAVAVSRPSSR